MTAGEGRLRRLIERVEAEAPPSGNARFDVDYWLARLNDMGRRSQEIDLMHLESWLRERFSACPSCGHPIYETPEENQ